jgi:DNA-binding IclR family transcriptional regulator
MPCVSADGRPTESGLKMLGALKAGKKVAEDIASASGMPLYRVRSGLRDLVEAGYVTESDGAHSLTDKGATAI